MAEKKLVRSANKKLAGVCGGLAEYLVTLCSPRRFRLVGLPHHVDCNA